MKTDDIYRVPDSFCYLGGILKFSWGSGERSLRKNWRNFKILPLSRTKHLLLRTHKKIFRTYVRRALLCVHWCWAKRKYLKMSLQNTIKLSLRVNYHLRFEHTEGRLINWFNMFTWQEMLKKTPSKSVHYKDTGPLKVFLKQKKTAENMSIAKSNSGWHR